MNDTIRNLFRAFPVGSIVTTEYFGPDVTCRVIVHDPKDNTMPIRVKSLEGASEGREMWLPADNIFATGDALETFYVATPEVDSDYYMAGKVYEMVNEDGSECPGFGPCEDGDNYHFEMRSYFVPVQMTREEYIKVSGSDEGDFSTLGEGSVLETEDGQYCTVIRGEADGDGDIYVYNAQRGDTQYLRVKGKDRTPHTVMYNA